MRPVHKVTRVSRAGGSSDRNQGRDAQDGDGDEEGGHDAPSSGSSGVAPVHSHQKHHDRAGQQQPGQVGLDALDRLKLTAIRDQLDTLLDEAARSDMTLREALGFLISREIARRDERRIEMALGLARFSMVRDLTSYDFAAQPAVDKQQIRELATGRFVATVPAGNSFGPAGSSMKVTGDLGVKHELDDPNRTIQESRSWVTQFGAHQGSVEEQVAKLDQLKDLGVELIGRVPPTLHTPLMSGANAVSGITVVGALVVAGAGYGWISTVLGFLAIAFAMFNVVGGYAVTDRMLEMFRKDAPKPDAKPDAVGAGGTR